MRSLIAVVAALVLALAGCTDGSSDDGADPSPTPAPPAGPDPDRTETFQDNWTYNGFTPIGDEVTLATFSVTEGAAQIDAFVERESANVKLFADNCRLYDGAGQLRTQEAFSDQQIGNVFTTGTCELEIGGYLAPGDWELVYLTTKAEPVFEEVGSYVVDVTYTAEALEQAALVG